MRLPRIVESLLHPSHYCEEMSAEEKPPKQIDADSTADIPEDSQDMANAPVEAEFAESEVVNAEVKSPISSEFGVPPRLAPNLENLSANGGAVGAFVLGLWCFLGSFITSWSLINGVLGLPLGVWGLISRKKKTAWIGIVLCLIGSALCILQVGEWISLYFNAIDETQL